MVLDAEIDPSILTDTSESTASQIGMELADDDLSWWSEDIVVAEEAGRGFEKKARRPKFLSAWGTPYSVLFLGGEESKRFSKLGLSSCRGYSKPTPARYLFVSIL